MTNKTILLIEDNADDEALTLLAFRKSKMNIEVDVARDGAEALDYFRIGSQVPSDAPAGLPVVVLLDLNLPKVSGLEVLRRLRADERTRVLPVVILTSSKEEGDLAEGYRLGANSYVCKPVDFDAFAEAARNLGLYWLELNESPPAAG